MRKRLERVVIRAQYVTVQRRKGWEPLRGYVVAVGAEWFVLVSVPDAFFDGLAVLRVQDVRSVKRARRGGRARRGLALDGQWPPAAPDLLELDDVRQVLFTAGGLARTLGIADERPRGVSVVATVDRITRRRLESREVLPSGRWSPTPRVLDLDRITKVVLWDPYVERITQLADEAAD